MISACYPGSFDPPTLGHLDIISRAQGLYQRLVVAIGHNPNKIGGLSVDKRLQLLRELCAPWPHVEVCSYEGATVHFAAKLGVQALIRGLRSYADFNHERGMAEINRRHGFETLFLIAESTHTNLSSSLVRQVQAAGLGLEGLVPPAVAAALAQQAPGQEP
ncbi:MAG: pantetheine-phosphate adenylyltransferase [Planctomycetota bacterium]|nr:MAG: pantetheine-phosphate adenylyltransferase [Planctomycetota bacterium]